MEDAKRALTDKSCHFCKPLTMFPTGKALLERCAKQLEQRTRDKAFLGDLQLALKRVVVPPLKTKISESQIEVEAKDTWIEVHQTLVNIKANASEQFLDHIEFPSPPNLEYIETSSILLLWFRFVSPHKSDTL